MILPFYILQEIKRPIYALRNIPPKKKINKKKKIIKKKNKKKKKKKKKKIYININGLNYKKKRNFRYSGGGHFEFVQNGPLVM